MISSPISTHTTQTQLFVSGLSCSAAASVIACSMLFLLLSVNEKHIKLSSLRTKIQEITQNHQRMQNGGGAAVDVNAAAPTKRVRRPNVRLHQPYYEYSGSRTLQQQWKDLEGARKPRTHRAQNVKTSKKSNNYNNREGTKELLNFEDDDDVAIGSWKKLNVGKRDRDSKSKSKRKRIRPTGSHENEDDEKSDDFTLSNDGDSEKQEEEEEEENLDADGGKMVNFEPEDSDFNDDDNNVVGVGTWLKELGLGKYLPVFEVHEVDDEVLPFLTLEDLKDMGISAVGSRRKMYCSIQKLGKKF